MGALSSNLRGRDAPVLCHCCAANGGLHRQRHHRGFYYPSYAAAEFQALYYPPEPWAPCWPESCASDDFELVWVPRLVPCQGRKRRKIEINSPSTEREQAVAPAAVARHHDSQPDRPLPEAVAETTAPGQHCATVAPRTVTNGSQNAEP